MKSSESSKPAFADWVSRQRDAADTPPWWNGFLDALSIVAIEPDIRTDLLETLNVLDDMRADQETLAACIVFALQAANAAWTAGIDFAPHLRDLLDGQQAAEKVWSLYASRGVHGSAEGLRRLLLAIIRDLRVVFILLARQVATLRGAAKTSPERERDLAQLTADIHAPLANRLGIWQLKWELEDLSFRYLHPDIYRRIATLLDERRDQREQYITDATDELRRALADAEIEGDVAGRPKHIYSIWKKMQRKGDDFSSLYDIRALRVLVQDVPACYAALGVVHTLWPPVPSEFDDYIARPKGNRYQSLHTAVIGPEGKTLEVQIRSFDMHAHAERGVAAHWRYKEGGGGDQEFERKVAWMRQLLETKDDNDDEAALLAGFKTDILEDRVYLLTPQGQVMDLPRGATVLDFAYTVHTDVGHRTRGAKVNARIVQLNFQPASGDRVEILTGKVKEPRRDWLSSHHGFLNTHRAQQKVRTWFKRVDLDANLAAGRSILDKELRRMALHNVDLDTLPPKFGQKNLEEFLVALALGEITSGNVVRALHESDEPSAPAAVVAPRAPKRGKDAVIIEGVGNLLTTLARCCQPLPGDAIVGYITRGKGVSIHRSDCAAFARLRVRDAARAIDVEWGGAREQAYEVDVLVKGYDRKWLHKDVTNVIAAANVHMLAANARVDSASGLATMNFALRVTDYEQLSMLLGRLSGVANVIEARRLA